MTPSSTTPLPSENDNLLVTVRFSASITDLRLDINSPETTTAAGLKQAIRARLPSSLSFHRLRLIYAGRGLEDATPLTVSLKLPPPSTRFPPRSTVNTDIDNDADSNDADSNDAKGKGKAKALARDPPRIYIHCSIGDIVLSETDLAAEAAVSSTLHNNQSSHASSKTETLGHQSHTNTNNQLSSSTTPAPRGFDRLLSAGFTAAEVTALRSQFMAIQSVSRTPDMMPSGSELRELEDRWMDEGSSAMGAGAVAGGEGVAFNDDDGGFGSRGAIDDMLWGAVMGFFWPVGCAMWLRREEGVWSWRKGLAVFVGVVVNIGFGAMRIMN